MSWLVRRWRLWRLRRLRAGVAYWAIGTTDHWTQMTQQLRAKIAWRESLPTADLPRAKAREVA